MINFMVVVDFFVYTLHIIFLHVCLYLPHVHSSIPFSLFSPVNIYIYISSFRLLISLRLSVNQQARLNLWLLSLSLHLHALDFRLLLTHIP